MRANGMQPDKGIRAGEFPFRKGADPNGEVWEVLDRVEGLVASRKKSESGGGKGGNGGNNGRDSKLEAKKRHWNEEWKRENAEKPRECV